MNGIEKITERIAVDADRERNEILEHGRKQAAEISAGYDALAETGYAETVARGKNQAAERVQRIRSVAELDARKLRLSAKQEMLDRAFDLALEKLLHLPEAEYAALLTELAVAGAATGGEALVFSVKDRPRYGKRVVIAANEALEAAGRTGALTLSEESREFDGGLYLQDGNVETNCTFPTIVRMLREKMAGEVAQILFE